MKQSEAKDFLPIIEAWSKGEVIQIYDSCREVWEDITTCKILDFIFPITCYRIKPIRKWYRIGEDKNGCLLIARSDITECNADAASWFKRWITTRIEYE